MQYVDDVSKSKGRHSSVARFVLSVLLKGVVPLGKYLKCPPKIVIATTDSACTAAEEFI